jgi:hypothetical protein
VESVNALTPAAGAAVMATGILSAGLRLAGHEGAALAALALAGVVWAVCAGVFAARLARGRERWRREAMTPAGLTGVAATCVLGTCLSLQGWQEAAALALALSAVLWPLLLVTVVRGWEQGLPGVVFLVCVATEGLAVGAGTLAVPFRLPWLCWAGLVLFVLGLALYGMALVRFDLREVRAGAGDHWIAGGALSISALAAAKLTAAADPRGPLGWAPWLHGTLRTATMVLLAASLLWFPLLVYAEVRWPRTRYDIRRWATVFPLGMTAVACLVVADAAGLPVLGDLGRVLLWVAVAAWLLTAAGAARAWRRAADRRGARTG